MKQAPTSPYAPDLEEPRSWLEKRVAQMKLVELVAAVIALIARMRAINLELTKRVAHLTRKRPRSETLERLERQLVLPLMGLTASPAAKKNTGSDSDPPRDKKKRSRGGGRGAFPAYVPRVDIPNPVPDNLRICPHCGAQMRTVAHSVCENDQHRPGALLPRATPRRDCCLPKRRHHRFRSAPARDC
ncbi:MAG TPA: hypothetical protein VHW01_08105 [Polyangiaceae bacterium]|jgi:hypothetical protein|nr:hypothetical protein [Polyangiaceae bacterium]